MNAVLDWPEHTAATLGALALATHALAPLRHLRADTVPEPGRRGLTRPGRTMPPAGTARPVAHHPCAIRKETE